VKERMVVNANVGYL